MSSFESPSRQVDVHTESGPGPNGEIARLRELVRGIRTAMLMTRAERGHLRGRPMLTIASERRDELWFYIDTRSRIVDEIQEDHQVALVYVDPPRFVTVAGVAHVVEDAEQVRRYWDPAAAEWFPEGPDADRYLALLRVQLEEAEYWDRNAEEMVKLFGFDAADETPVRLPQPPSATEPPAIEP